MLTGSLGPRSSSPSSSSCAVLRSPRTLDSDDSQFDCEAIVIDSITMNSLRSARGTRCGRRSSITMRTGMSIQHHRSLGECFPSSAREATRYCPSFRSEIGLSRSGLYSSEQRFSMDALAMAGQQVSTFMCVAVVSCAACQRPMSTLTSS